MWQGIWSQSRLYETYKRKNPCKTNDQKTPNNTILHQITPKIIENTINNKQCRYCQRIFTRISSLERHMKDRCKIEKQNNNNKENLLQKLSMKWHIMKNKIRKIKHKDANEFEKYIKNIWNLIEHRLLIN